MIIAVLVAAGLVVWALDHGYRRRPYPRNRLAGSTDVYDRDVQRLEGDLVAEERHCPTLHSNAANRSWTTTAPGTRSAA